MEELQQLTRFINTVVTDTRLKPVHVLLSLALCHCWMKNRFQRSYRVSRRVLMEASRIRSRATYHKVIRELQEFGYLKYFPSYHPVEGSKVEINESYHGNK